MVTKIKVTEKKPIKLYMVGDIHLGSITCAEKALDQTIEMIKKDPQARVILMGDQGDYIFPDDTRRYDPACNSVFPSATTTTAALYKKFKPIRKKIMGVLRGNHEATYAKTHLEEYEGMAVRDEAEVLAVMLDVQYLEDMGVIKLKLGKADYTIVAMHGINCSSTVSSQINKLSKLSDIFETTPHLVAMGHVHSLQTILNPKLTYDFKTKLKHVALTGNYFKTYIEGNMNYASGQLYGALPVGCVMYEFDGKGNIKDNKIIFD
jgi:hypothetical protein